MLEKLINFFIFILVFPLLMILLVYVVARKLINRNWDLFVAKEGSTEPKNASIVGVPFSNMKMDDALALISENIEHKKRATYFFLNPHAINLSKKDPHFYSILCENKVNFPDGMGMKLAGLFENYKLQDNLCGTDLYPRLMDVSQKEMFSVFFLGGSAEVVSAMAANAKETWPNLNLVGHHHGYFNKETESQSVVDLINEAAPDIVLVSFGMPIQEKWIDAHFSKLNVKAAFATGGLFDFFSGKVKRAPLVWRQVGMEWAYRLIVEPKRMWRRYVIGNPLFLVHVLKDRYLSGK